MIINKVNELTFFQFHNLQTISGIKHFTSTRVGGVSQNHLASLNLGYTVNDNPEFVDRNLEILAEAAGIEKGCMVFPKQTNGNNVAIVNTKNEIFTDTDALITNKPGICIGIRTADCVPILVYEPEKKVIAAIHSGWKGTVDKISKKAITLMITQFGADPEKMIAGIGPSISPDVYEIGPDVITLVKQAFADNHVLKEIQGTDKAFFNLWKANKNVFIECGIPAKNIEIAQLCTFSNPDLFYSARRDNHKTGRLATGIMIL